MEKRLVIELDSSQNADNQRYDSERTAWLNARGFKVLRFWNHDVLQQTTTVLDIIIQALSVG